MANREARWSLSRAGLSTPTKVRIAVGVSAVYAAAHVLLFHPLLGDASGILGMAPVLLFAILFGAAGGALAGVTAMVFLMLTASALSDRAWLDWLWPGGMLGTTGLVVIGALTGHYRDVAADLKAARVRAVDTPAHAPRRHTYRGLMPSGQARANGPSKLDLAMVVEQLSDREADVLRLVAEGLPNKEIATTMGISLHTVKTHVSVILRKLAASNRTGAVGIARELDIID